MAFSGAVLPAFDRQGAGASDIGTTALPPGALTPTGPASIVVTGLCNTFGAGATVDGGFAAVSHPFVFEEAIGIGLAYLLQPAAAAANPTWSWTPAANSGAAIASFHASVSSTVTGVTVAPTGPTVAGGATQAFTAVVAGTGGPSQVVTWTTDLGTVTSGVLTAPAATGSIQTGHVTAHSAQDGTKTGSATFTVPASGGGTGTTTWQTGVAGFAAGLVGGTTSGFGFKVGLDGGAMGPLVTAGIVPDSAGSYSAQVAVAAGSMPRFRWLDGSGGDVMDYRPVALPGAGGGGGGGGGSFPSVAPAGWIAPGSIADALKYDGTMRAASSPTTLHLDPADAVANALAIGAVNQYLYVDTGAGAGQSVPVASVAAGSGGRDAAIQPGYALLVPLDPTSRYHWTGQSSVVTSLPPTAVVVSGSGATVVVAGYPAGKVWDGQRLYHVPSGEVRMIASHSYAAPNYTLTLVGSFSAVAPGDAVSLLS